MIDELKKRYHRLCHAMQSGVAFKMTRDPADTTPKNLRVGINSAMVETSAIVQLLIDKGMLTEQEWLEYLCQGMAKEVNLYQQELSESTGTNITLG